MKKKMKSITGAIKKNLLGVLLFIDNNLSDVLLFSGIIIISIASGYVFSVPIAFLILGVLTSFVGILGRILELREGGGKE